MKPPDEVARELVRQWLAKAEKDYRLAEHLLAEQGPYLEAIGFNCQQAAEKYLKALLTLRQVPFPRTHNLGELLDLIATVDRGLADSLREITALNPYAVGYRYPAEFPEVTPEDARAAFDLAARVRGALLPVLEACLGQKGTGQ
jgi:HEPN domain-containing protein